MLKKIAFVLCLFVVFSYQNINHYFKWVVDMKEVNNDSIHLNFTYINANLISLDRTPLFKEQVIKNYKGLPSYDSISYYGNFETTLQFYYDLYKTKLYDKHEFLKLVKKINIDTLKFSQTPLKQGFISIVGFYKNKQFIIADANRNQTFNDDIKYEFDINLRKDPSKIHSILSKLPKTQYSYQTYSKGKIQTYNRKIILYPNMFGSHIPVSSKETEYLSSFKFVTYWKGEEILGNIVYDFCYQALDNTFGAIYIKPKTISFTKDDGFNNQFLHYTKDTIAIGSGYYKIDSINRKISKLYLRKIKENKDKYGQEVGGFFKNIKVEDLDNNHFSTDSIIKKKKYTLIDFWGTWCGPCIELTPKLVNLQNKYFSKLTIISIANDKNKKVVKDYVSRANMNWLNGFVNNNNNVEILTSLTIQQYPTFILIDSTGKILLRGTTEEFSKIENIIK